MEHNKARESDAECWRGELRSFHSGQVGHGEEGITHTVTRGTSTPGPQGPPGQRPWTGRPLAVDNEQKGKGRRGQAGSLRTLWITVRSSASIVSKMGRSLQNCEPRVIRSISILKRLTLLLAETSLSGTKGETGRPVRRPLQKFRQEWWWPTPQQELWRWYNVTGFCINRICWQTGCGSKIKKRLQGCLQNVHPEQLEESDCLLRGIGKSVGSALPQGEIRSSDFNKHVDDRK